MIETDMTNAIAEKAREALVDRIPLGRLGAPDEVARGGVLPGVG